MRNMYIYIFVVAFVTYLIRVIPLTLLRRPIKNKFIRSFLFYVPYVTLAAMTFPAIIYSPDSMIAGIFALVSGILAAWFGGNLFVVALSCSAVVLLAELFLNL